MGYVGDDYICWIQHYAWQGVPYFLFNPWTFFYFQALIVSVVLVRWSQKLGRTRSLVEDTYLRDAQGLKPSQASFGTGDTCL